MSHRTTILLSALTSVLVFVLLMVGSQLFFNPPVQARSDANALPSRTITVIGEGTATAAPDTAHVQIGVETDAPTTQEALAANNQQVAAIIDRLKALGIEEKDIQTTNFNISANYDSKGQRVTGYHISNNVSVTIPNLDQAGTLLDEVVQLGANRIYGISFDIDDPTELYNEAREKAITDARTKAAQMATASGATLGDVTMITEQLGSSPPILRGMPMMEGGMALDSAASVPIAAGEQDIRIQVQLSFELR